MSEEHEKGYKSRAFQVLFQHPKWFIAPINHRKSNVWLLLLSEAELQLLNNNYIFYVVYRYSSQQLLPNQSARIIFGCYIKQDILRDYYMKQDVLRGYHMKQDILRDSGM